MRRCAPMDDCPRRRPRRRPACAAGEHPCGHRRRRHRRRRHQRERPRGRRVGHRGNARFAGALHQDCRHGRSRALRGARSAGGELQRLGARLWPGGQRQSDRQARAATQSDRDRGSERGRRGALLPRNLLVLDAENSTGFAIRRQERDSGELYAERMVEFAEEQWVRRLPSARPAFNPHLRAEPGQVPFVGGRLGAARAVRAGGATDDWPACRHGTGRDPEFRRLDGPHCQGRVAARQAACGRRASNAISW